MEEGTRRYGGGYKEVWRKVEGGMEEGRRKHGRPLPVYAPDTGSFKNSTGSVWIFLCFALKIRLFYLNMRTGIPLILILKIFNILLTSGSLLCKSIGIIYL